jgi:glucokinase
MNTTHTATLPRTEWIANRANPAQDAFDLAARVTHIAAGALLVGWGIATLYPVVSTFTDASWSLHSTWFAGAVGAALVASGTILVLNDFVAFSLAILVPVSVHLLFATLLSP